MATRIEDYRSVWLFFGITYAFSWLFWIPLALSAHNVPLPPALVDFLNSPLNPAAFGPLFAAFLLTLLREGRTGIWHLLKRGFTLRARGINTRGSVLATMLLHTSMNWSIWLFMPDMQVSLPVIGFTIALLIVATAVIIRVWGADRLSRIPEEP